MRKIILSVCLVTISIMAFAQWAAIKQGVTENNLTSVCFTDVNTGYAVGDSGTILKTTNGGTTWQYLPSGTTKGLTEVSFTDANNGYIVGAGGTILKTIDAGATWNYIPIEMQPDLSSAYFADVNTGYVMDESGTVLLKTNNGGTTWTSLWSNVSNSNISSVFFTDENTGYAVGSFDIMKPPSRSVGVILRTTDGGVNWELTGFNTTTWLTSVFFTDANTGYVVGGDGIILKTTNAGINWNTLSSGTTNWLSAVYFQNASTGYAVGGTILKTTDAGATWAAFPGLTTNILSCVCFPNANEGYAVGDYGTILKITDEGEITSIKDAESDESTFAIYPSPATDKITISSKRERPGQTIISILDANGKQLLTARYLNQSKYEMDVSMLSKGVYLVKIQTKAGIESKKLVIQ